MREGRASNTARLIALATVMWPELAPPGAARWVQQLLGDRPWACSRLGRTLGAVLEKAALPGITNHWLSRKCEIDRLAREATGAGFEQLLVIGAGLDSLSYRMADERLFERVISIDHSATQSALPSMPGGVELFPIDLSGDDTLPNVSPLPTLIVIEGLLMYLPEAAVERLLARLARLEVPRARLVASWMLDMPGRPIGFREQAWFVSAWLRVRGEVMLWASAPDRLTLLLERAGWRDIRIFRFALESEQLAIAESSLDSPAPAFA